MIAAGQGNNGGAASRIVMHIDLDYFYAQCEEARNPSLGGKPLVVCVYSGRTEDSGVVSTANYVARKYGVKSGIPIKLAKSRLADTADSVLLPMDMPYYSKVSENVMSVIQQFAEKFEQVGIDECFVDVTSNVGSFDEARSLALQIKESIRQNAQLSCSIGVGPNKMIAKIASDFQKPDGLTVVDSTSAKEFVAGLAVDRIPGIGPKTTLQLAELGISKVGELVKIDQFKLVEEFGRGTATFLYNAARAVDEEPVVVAANAGERKQIARIVTLKNDASSSTEMSDELYQLCRAVLDAARNRDVSFKTISILLILTNLNQKTKSRSLKTHSNDFDVLHSTARALLDDLMAATISATDRKVRRLGVRLSEFHDNSGQNTMSQFIGD
ncbi:MAG TPA: DNA polymerase IV [Nitrososphaera sp.]|nr:DNA polymerase IV [Nitrososphaera sp.]